MNKEDDDEEEEDDEITKGILQSINRQQGRFRLSSVHLLRIPFVFDRFLILS